MIGKENLPQTEINKQQFFEFTRQIDKKDIAEYLKSEGLEDVLNSFFDNSIQPINQRLSLFREILDYIDTLYQITKELEFEDGIFSEDKVMNRNNFIVFLHLLSAGFNRNYYCSFYQFNEFIKKLEISFNRSFYSETYNDKYFKNKIQLKNKTLTEMDIVEKTKTVKLKPLVISINPFIESNDTKEVLKTLRFSVEKRFSGIKVLDTTFPNFDNKKGVDKLTFLLLNIYFDIDRSETIKEMANYLAGRIYSPLKQKSKMIYIKDLKFRSVESGCLPLCFFTDREIKESFDEAARLNTRKSITEMLQIQSYSEQERFLKLYLDWVRDSDE